MLFTYYYIVPPRINGIITASSPVELAAESIAAFDCNISKVSEAAGAAVKGVTQEIVVEVIADIVLIFPVNAPDVN